MIKITDINNFIYDFDGIMTNNKFILNSNGTESVYLNRSDGLAIQYFRNKGINQMIISTEENEIVKIRAKKLNIRCYNAINNKKDKIFELKKNKSLIGPILFVGNDNNDLDIMKISDLKVCPADSSKEIKKISDIVLKVNGGDGVIRELMNVYNEANS